MEHLSFHFSPSRFHRICGNLLLYCKKVTTYIKFHSSLKVEAKINRFVEIFLLLLSPLWKCVWIFFKRAQRWQRSILSIITSFFTVMTDANKLVYGFEVNLRTNIYGFFFFFWRFIYHVAVSWFKCEFCGKPPILPQLNLDCFGGV